MDKPTRGYRFHRSLVFLTPELGWIAGHGKGLLVFRTVNGGRDWEECQTTPTQPPERVRDLFFFDQQRGWLATWNRIGEGGGNYLYSTLDGGKHWTPGSADPGFGLLTLHPK
jgi:photosystem II stability/assembly factor-like uncharacterized protein